MDRSEMKSKRAGILVIDGNPNAESLCAALAHQYAEQARAAGVDVGELRLRELSFDPCLRTQNPSAQALETDLRRAQALIEGAQHICLVTPVWWGSVPALLKGFFDRVLERGWAYRYTSQGLPEGLLAGRTATVLLTTDSPNWYLRWVQGDPTVHQVVRSTLKFCGIKPVQLKRFGPVHSSKPQQREGWLVQAGRQGRMDARLVQG